jgi:hypothetical protein
VSGVSSAWRAAISRAPRPSGQGVPEESQPWVDQLAEPPRIRAVGPPGGAGRAPPGSRTRLRPRSGRRLRAVAALPAPPKRRPARPGCRAAPAPPPSPGCSQAPDAPCRATTAGPDTGSRGSGSSAGDRPAAGARSSSANPEPRPPSPLIGETGAGRQEQHPGKLPGGIDGRPRSAKQQSAKCSSRTIRSPCSARKGPPQPERTGAFQRPARSPPPRKPAAARPAGPRSPLARRAAGRPGRRAAAPPRPRPRPRPKRGTPRGRPA